MDRDAFYRKLVRALLNSNFRFRAEDIPFGDVNTERDKLSSNIRLAAELAPSIVGAITGGGVPGGVSDIHPVFDQAAIKERLDKLREQAALVCLKYMLAQPVIVVVVEADQLSHNEAIASVKKFDEAVLGMLDLTGSIGGIKFGATRFGATRLSVTGIVLFTFFNHEMALNFIQNTQGSCKICRFWKKTHVLPWVIDIAAKGIRRHSGLPITVQQILSPNKLALELFGA